MQCVTIRARSLFLVILAGLVAAASHGLAATHEIGFLEDFALADDRNTAVQQLVPGTPEHYYYQCLHLLQQRELEQVAKQLKTWRQQHDRDSRYLEIEHRLHLLMFPETPNATWEYLRRTLALRFDHQREDPDKEANLPSQLTADSISRETLWKRDSSRGAADLDSLHPSADDWLIHLDLDDTRRRQLLARLTWPGYAHLPDLIVQDLKAKGSRGFGSLKIHNMLLLNQLDRCAALHPRLLESERFVATYLGKLGPASDTDPGLEDVSRGKTLGRMWKFVQRLPPKHVNWKVHVLHHLLDHERSQGRINRELFMEYVKLPRRAPHVSERWLARVGRADSIADFKSTAPSEATHLPIIRDDRELVRFYLDNILANANDFSPYAPYFAEAYLKRVFAEAKLVRGIGRAQRWYAMLTPAQVESLRNRIDLDFSPTNPQHYGREDLVALRLGIKNVSSLIINIYEINAGNYYRNKKTEINTGIELDGLVPNFRQTHRYDKAPLQRTEIEFTFPELKRPGIYVIDFIGNGRSSRALVRKGQLDYQSITEDQGQIVTVFDENNQLVRTASVWLDGHQFDANASGRIAIPFSNQPTTTAMILQHGEVASLRSFRHQDESYAIRAAMYVDRESLLTGSEATVLMRAQLLLNGMPISIEHLENTTLTIDFHHQDGIDSSEQTTITLSDRAESTYRFRVPPRLEHVTFKLDGQRQPLTSETIQELSVSQRFTVNRIDASEQILSAELLRSQDQYLAEVRGRTGELRKHQPVVLHIRHRDFREPVIANLKTDSRGQVQLGNLNDITSVRVAIGKYKKTWQIKHDQRTLPDRICVGRGQSIQLPVGERGTRVSLLEQRNRTYVEDRSSRAQVQDGTLLIQGLEAGDYELWIKDLAHRVKISVVDGIQQDDTVVGRQRMLPRTHAIPVSIREVKSDDRGIQLALRNASAKARVHVFASHFEPTFSAFDQYARIRMPAPTVTRRVHYPSRFVEGRTIGDEYQYILDRQLAKKFPGNMLRRPELILNPWQLQEAQTERVHAETGDAFEAAPEVEDARGSDDMQRRSRTAPATDQNNLDYLPRATLVLANLKLDDSGRVLVPRGRFAKYQQLLVVVIDGGETVSHPIALEPQAWQPRDLRLLEAFPHNKHRVGRQQVTLLNRGDTLTLAYGANTQLRIYDELADVFQLLNTTADDSRLQKFSFLSKWDTLSAESKAELYNRFTCHELNLFLFRKDRAYFDRVVKPHLANKRFKLFMDDYLLERELTKYLVPNRYQRLNVFERILLGQRVEGEREAMRRWVTDQMELVRPPLPYYQHLFQMALSGRPMSQVVSESLGSSSSKRLPAATDRGRGLGVGGTGLNRGLIDFGFQAPAPNVDEDLAEASPEGSAGQDRPDGIAPRSARQAAGPTPLVTYDFYRRLAMTKEWAERHYDHLPLQGTTSTLFPMNRFWQDFSRQDPAQKFLSKHWVEATSGRNEKLLALSLIDLPFTAEVHSVDRTGDRLTVTAASPAIVFHEEFIDVDTIDEESTILVSQQRFDPLHRSEKIEGHVRDRYLDHDQFFVGRPYGCQIIVTNSSSVQRDIQLTLQVPAGSIPLRGGRASARQSMQLNPFSTVRVEYFFYFPEAGEFEHYPVQVTEDKAVVAAGNQAALSVAAQAPKVDTTSWHFVSQFGTNDQVLDFLDRHNVHELPLNKIAFRMRDAKFHRDALNILRRRHAYDETLWSYAIHHRHPATTQEYLLRNLQFVKRCGLRLKSDLLTFDAEQQFNYEHLEYHPLLNARAHPLGSQRTIPSPRFHAQYQRFLKLLSYQPQLTSRDRIALTHYLILQDRIEESIATFARVVPSELESQIQYDYMQAYLDCFRLRPKLAREIAERYIDYPVERWRNGFRSILAMLDQIQTGQPQLVDAEDHAQQQTAQSNAAPQLELRQQADQIVLDVANIRELNVRYYLMDLELLFSRRPFMRHEAGQFTTIHPNASQTLEVTADQREVRLRLPETMRNKNVLVEVSAAGLSRAVPVYSDDLSVRLHDRSGQVQIFTEAGRTPLPKVYVKVYAEHKNGMVQFYKDGYTDLRGRFDYTGVSALDLSQVKRFAILVASEEHGATVRETLPPKE